MQKNEATALSIDDLDVVSGGRMKQISAYRPPPPDTGPGHPQSSLQSLQIAEAAARGYGSDDMLPPSARGMFD